MWPGAGAGGIGGEDDEGVDEHGGFVFLNTDLHGLDGGVIGKQTLCVRRSQMLCIQRS